MSDEHDAREVAVVVNDEDQYSVWATERGAPPPGWTETGFRGERAACLAHIDEIWTDMRPRSVRNGSGQSAGPKNVDISSANNMSPSSLSSPEM